MKVRVATPDDMEGIVDCARHYDLVATDDDYVATLVQLSLACEGMFVAEDEGKVVGFCCSIVLPHPFGGFLYLDVVALFVMPKYRDTWAAPGLLRHLLRFSSTQPLHLVKIAAPLSSRLGRLLERAGFASAEVVYLRGDRWQSHRS